MKISIPLGFALVALSAAVSAQTAQAVPAVGSDTRTFECSADALKADVQLRVAGADAASDAVTAMHVNDRHLDPTTLQYINTLASGRTVTSVDSACENKALDVVFHLSPSPGDKRETITVTARGTTVKVQ